MKALSRILQRHFHSTQISRIDAKKVKEVQIPVPWGHIAGRWWGRQDAEPILALHGWLDNAGTWDPLMRLMPESGRPVLAIDFPGYGLSSHLPRFLNYHVSDTSYCIELIRQHYNIGKLTILGHSGGSAAGFIYASTFPDHIVGYFGIDYVLQSRDPKRRAKNLGPDIDKLIKLALREATGERSYDEGDVRRLWSESTYGSVTEESAKILMERGTRRVSDGQVVFTRDQRHKGPIIEAYSVAQVENHARHIRCKVALVKALQSPLFDKGLSDSPRVLGLIKENAETFVLHEVDGKHHVHMDRPDLILPLLLDFLEKL